MANPIWKDYYVSLGSADSIEYRILCNNEVIYSGKAWKRPGHSTNDIRINDICADYLQNVFPSLVGSTFTVGEYVTFFVQTLSDSTWTTKVSVQFDNNWSYEYDHDPARDGMSIPVNGHVDIRQWVVFTAYNATTITATIRLADGSSFDVLIPVAISDDFNADFNNDFSQSVRSTQTGTAVFDLSKWGNVKSMTIDNKVFTVVNECSRYALYYANAYGGWDSLLIEGNHSEVDNLTRHTRESEYDNRSIQNRGILNYVNEVSKTLTLHTSWLSDDEAARMHHLLNSTNVYLGDLVTGQMIPVILTDTKSDYKTYKGNGGKLVNYSINVTIAQERIRR